MPMITKVSRLIYRFVTSRLTFLHYCDSPRLIFLHGQIESESNLSRCCRSIKHTQHTHLLPSSTFDSDSLVQSVIGIAENTDSFLSLLPTTAQGRLRILRQERSMEGDQCSSSSFLVPPFFAQDLIVAGHTLCRSMHHKNITTVA